MHSNTLDIHSLTRKQTKPTRVNLSNLQRGKIRVVDQESHHTRRRSLPREQHLTRIKLQLNQRKLRMSKIPHKSQKRRGKSRIYVREGPSRNLSSKDWEVVQTSKMSLRMSMNNLPLATNSPISLNLTLKNLQTRLVQLRMSLYTSRI